MNVVRGRPILLGRIDFAFWLPSAVLLVAGTGGAIVLGQNNTQQVWRYALIWIASVSLVVVIGFGRLLLAVSRVRKDSLLREEPVMIESDRRPTFLPPISVEAQMSSGKSFWVSRNLAEPYARLCQPSGKAAPVVSSSKPNSRPSAFAIL